MRDDEREVAAALWTRSDPAASLTTGSAALWNVELSSAGPRPVTALVFGEEAGVHLVRLPAAGGSDEARRHIPVRLAQGNVYLVSLGRSGLDASTASPAGAPPMAFDAQARFVKRLHTAEATGVRTGWW